MSTSKWQLELKNTIKTIKELFKLLNIDSDLINSNKLNLIYQKGLNPNINNYSKFPLLVTKSFIKRIKPNDIHDPLLLQILPVELLSTISTNLKINSETNVKLDHCKQHNNSEHNWLNNHSDNQLINQSITVEKNYNYYSKDPLEEKSFNYIPGLIHKYYGRVLILSNKSCAIHCRYCFRQNFSYNNNIASGNNLEQIITYIRNNDNIEEIILSGGDPLLATNKYFEKLLLKLEHIPHLTTIRIHSRIPIVLPSRLDRKLISILSKSKFKIVLVVHTNHPNEINTEVAKYLNKIHNTKITLLNQSVLLKNINNNHITLAKLSKKLFELNILPYYLHLLDPVMGAEYFAITLSEAKKIYAELAAILPGYLLPKLVIEKPGAKNKLLITADHLYYKF